MKKLGFILFAALAVLLSGCDNKEPVGYSKLNLTSNDLKLTANGINYEAAVPLQGGNFKISREELGFMVINGLSINDELITKPSDIFHENEPIEGEWGDIYISKENGYYHLTLNLNPNDSDNMRIFKIQLNSGNADKNLLLTQPYCSK